MKTQRSLIEDSQPWWSLPIMWMVLGGPAVVVVACFATYWVAVSHPDPVVADTGRFKASVQLESSVSKSGADLAEIPAQQARNHAATSR